ncbi:MAG: hypothetical protein OXC06_04200 [Acidimicrobiaceae bacterium]|nr:hypothetical protein [Acidimicrobiaceae bacterium]
MAANAAPLSSQARRYGAAALIVVAVAVSVWLFGRSEPSEPAVQVVATAEDWAARREPGRFVTVEMPEKAAALFVTPEELAGRVPAVAVPAGTVLSEALLTDPGTASAAEPSAALMAVSVDPSLWPDPGPVAGATAVLAAEPGGCAAAVMPILAAGEGTVVVEAGPELAARLGPAVWWVWESPAAGWPGCSDAAAYTVVHLGG